VDDGHVIDEGVNFRVSEGLRWNAKEATDRTNEVECSEVAEGFDSGCGGVGGILKGMGGDAGRAGEGGEGEGPGEAAAAVLDGTVRPQGDMYLDKVGSVEIKVVGEEDVVPQLAFVREKGE
jgi:hypothetical protein